MIGNSDLHDIESIYHSLRKNSEHMLGYPSTKFLDFTSLHKFLEIPMNNIGDPFSLSGSYKVNTHEIERNVIEWFSETLNARNFDVWGYVTNGGTEGNMYGIYLARELFPDGIVYYSEDTHYSVSKILQLTRTRSIMIKSLTNGEMDYNDLAASVAIHRDVPPIIFANIGTTMKGAVDDLRKIRKIMNEYAISRFYIHADAALSGMILPFVSDPQPFDFISGIDSISISGHKFPGCPIPCGVVLAKRDLVNRVARGVEYIGTNDTTISGSRNGLTPLFLWYIIAKLGKKGFIEIVNQCFSVADHAITKLQEKGLEAWRHKNSITVVFPRINERVLCKWQIASQGNNAHIITMPNVSKAYIDEFIEDLLG